MTDTDRTPGQTPDAGRDDHDLAALFAADKNSPPAFLNKTILAAAHEAVTADDNTAPEQASVFNDAPSPPTGRRWQTSGGWMAMAASVILAVTVVPLMLRAPDSSLNPGSADLPTMQAVEESMSLTSDSDTRAPENIDADAAPAMMPEAAPSTAPPTPMLPAIQLQRRSTFSDHAATEDEMAGAALTKEAGIAEDEGSANPADETAPDVSFRDTPQRWLAHIRQLLLDERYDDALAEYQSFRRLHPKHEPDFRVPVRQ